MFYYPLQGQKVEKLLNQGKLEKAIAHCEKQDDDDRTECYMTIGNYYLTNGDYTAAEEYYHKSGDIKKGYVKIAESYMKAEAVDSTVMIDPLKAENYLKKVYSDEKLVYVEMAKCFEKYAMEEKERLVLIKTMDDMGIIAMSMGGKAVDIRKAFASARHSLILYCNEGAKYYEKTGDIEKAEEVRKLMVDPES